MRLSRRNLRIWCAKLDFKAKHWERQNGRNCSGNRAGGSRLFISPVQNNRGSRFNPDYIDRPLFGYRNGCWFCDWVGFVWRLRLYWHECLG